MSYEPAPVSNRHTPLRVLLVEDSEDDALLLLRALRKGGYETKARRVDSETDLRAALTDAAWDVVFCDYAMPSLSGPAAVALIRESHPDLPVSLLLNRAEVLAVFAVALVAATDLDLEEVHSWV